MQIQAELSLCTQSYRGKTSTTTKGWRCCHANMSRLLISPLPAGEIPVLHISTRQIAARAAAGTRTLLSSCEAQLYLLHHSHNHDRVARFISDERCWKCVSTLRTMAALKRTIISEGFKRIVATREFSFHVNSRSR